MSRYVPFLVGSTHQVASSGVLEVQSSDGDCISSRSCLVCVAQVPAYMIPGELISFFESSISIISSIRVYRHYSEPEKYLAVVRLDSPESAVRFMEDFDGQLMSSIDNNTHCELSFIVDINLSNENSDFYDLSLLKMEVNYNSNEEWKSEEEKCPVCLEEISSEFPMSFTTCCQHKFHISCIGKLENPQCPVCRYQHDSSSCNLSECFTCGWQGVSEPSYAPIAQDSNLSIPWPASINNHHRDLWMCLICGYTGCGRLGEYHIRAHYEETLHTYAMNTDNRRVWDFAGDGYVHRLILNGPGGAAAAGASWDSSSGGGASSSSGTPSLPAKVVEVSHGEGSTMVRDTRAPLTSEQEELIVNRKLESAAYHYNQLLAWHMQQNRMAYETRLQRIRESVGGGGQNKSGSSSAAAAGGGSRPIGGSGGWKQNIMQSLRTEKQKAVKLVETAQERLQRARHELEVQQELQKSLERNLQEAQSKVNKANERYQAVQVSQRSAVSALETKVQGLMEKLDMVHHSDTGSRSQTSTSVTAASTAVQEEDNVKA